MGLNKLSMLGSKTLVFGNGDVGCGVCGATGKTLSKISQYGCLIPTLQRLTHSGIQRSGALRVKNQHLAGLAADPAVATAWVATMMPYIDEVTFDFVVVDNEVIPTDLAHHCRGEPLSLIPPSQGAFSPEAVAAMNPNTAFVTANDFPRMVNVYPYFGYKSDPEHIPLDHALFRPTSPVVQDGDLSYHNLFDATLDAVYSALEKVGGSTINIVALESGWPSAGYGDKTTVAMAQEYNNNLIQHAISTNGTPKRPGNTIWT
ncbi:hypothetical protein AMTRI_Chr04g249780 [Amborella trichopoda]